MGASDGGPAFPVSEEEARGKVSGVYGGMSIRKYYEEKAMQGILAGGFYNPGQADQIAKDAVAIADALIAARETKNV